MDISKGKIAKAQKIVVYGPEGIGKSTFFSHFPDPLWSDVEESTKDLDVRRFTDKAESFAGLIEQAKFVRDNPDICRSYIIDTADWAERLAVKGVCDRAKKTGIEDFGYGKGYVYVNEDFGKLLNVLQEIVDRGVNVGIAAHAVMRKFEQPDEFGAYDRWELKLDKRNSSMLKEWADMVLFANYETFVVTDDNKKAKAQGGKRVMFTSHHPCWDAKNRKGLVEKLPFEFKEIAHCLPNASQMQNETPEPKPVKELPKQNVEDNPSVSGADTSLYTRVDFPVGENVQRTKGACPGGATSGVNLEDDKKKAMLALGQLMTANGVTDSDIQHVVGMKGYFPKDMLIRDYPTEFINGVLIGAWSQVYELIKTEKEKAF